MCTLVHSITHPLLPPTSIITENEEDVLKQVTNHFDVKDKYENFEVKYGSDAKDNEEGRVHFKLRGLKRELGQTLNSTGLTMWRAAYHLCDYIYKSKAEKFKDKCVCELGAGLGMVILFFVCDVLLHIYIP